MSTVVITGCSSGFGLEIAKHFLKNDWNVVATMRDPSKNVLPESDKLRVLPLDVTNEKSIETFLEKVGDVDVIVNNAGLGGPSPLEITSKELILRLFETNTFGTLTISQAFMKKFREKGNGVIINITSSVTILPLPLLGAYRASKAAVNAFTESLALEAKPFGVRVNLVVPGRAPNTNFATNASAGLSGTENTVYGPMVKEVVSRLRDQASSITHASDVAEAVWNVATNDNTPLYTLAGADAHEWAAKAKLPY